MKRCPGPREDGDKCTDPQEFARSRAYLTTRLLGGFPIEKLAAEIRAHFDDTLVGPVNFAEEVQDFQRTVKAGLEQIDRQLYGEGGDQDQASDVPVLCPVPEHGMVRSMADWIALENQKRRDIS